MISHAVESHPTICVSVNADKQKQDTYSTKSDIAVLFVED